jgi:hypothetical protein
MTEIRLWKPFTLHNNRRAVSVACGMLFACALAAGAPQKALSSKAFIQKIYANYQNLAPGTDIPDVLSKALRKDYFSERFTTALERDERCTPAGDIGALSADVLIAAQDFGETGIGPITIKAIGGERFKVEFELFPEYPSAERSTSIVTVQLVLLNGQYRIANIDQALEALESAPCEVLSNFRPSSPPTIG